MLASTMYIVIIEKLKNYNQYGKIQKDELPKAGSKMLLIPDFYSLLMSTSTKVQTNHLEAF